MGTKVHCKSYLPAYYSMRDLNEDSNSCNWPLYYGDKTLTNGQYYNGFLPSAAADAYPGYDRDVVKRTMLEHEATFKNQVYELHRLYRIQRDLMDDIKRKELHRNRMPVETSLSSSPLASHITSDDARNWHNHNFPVANSVCGRTSVSGVEGIHSTLSSIKGNSLQTGPFPSQNGGSSKDLEVLESRPTKVRRKMFDLQLPADEYIDTEEGEQVGDKVSVISHFYPNRNGKTAAESGTNIFLNDSGKNGCKGDSLTSDACLRNTNGLADLNEPVQLEETKETNASAFIDLLGHDSCNGKIQGSDMSAKPNSQYLGLPKDLPLSSYHGSNNGTRNSSHLDNNGSGKGWFSYVLEAGQSKSNINSQSLQTEKLSRSPQSTQISLNKVHEPAFYLMDKSKVDLWRERAFNGLDISERSNDSTNNKHLGPFEASHVPSPYPIPPTTDLAKSSSHAVSSWEKPSNSLNQMSLSVQTYPGLTSSVTLNKSSQSSIQSDQNFGDRWNLNSNIRSNPGFGSELSYRNGFYLGSSSGSKELPIRLPSLNDDYICSSNVTNGAPGHLMNHGSAMHYKGSNCVEMKSSKDMNLNLLVSNSSSNLEIPRNGLEVSQRDQKHEDPLAVLPWLKAKPACKNEASNEGRLSKIDEMDILQSSMNQASNKSEIAKDSNQLFTRYIKSVSSANDPEARKIEPSECTSNRKILGFPIFDKPHLSKNETTIISPSVSFLSSSECKAESNRENRVLDINLPCEPAAPDMVKQNASESRDKGMDTKSAGFRHHIDLNAYLSDDDEAPLKPSSTSISAKFTTEIDLEAPVPETEDDAILGEASAVKHDEDPLASPHHKAELPQDQVMMMIAAEAIVALSSSNHHNHMDDSSTNSSEVPLKESSLTDPLAWFVEIVSSYRDDFEGKFDAALRGKDGEDSDQYSSETSDYFESMTLKLMETKEEDYMPKPLVPENLKLEETGTTLLSTRTRKGQARRGRQRRDFQRDILPGLASLSRHEVTEDLQTFGGLMRATGHSWHSGLARRNSTRNGSARGRRRALVSPSPPAPTPPACTPLIQHLSNINMGLENKSLTGWGKTPRRPRRQRCPPVNPPSIPLT
ncbi:hypothetical protein FEM48_Zijuj10G0092200 [Ziziphus jujuba var. spinosa]|uniref:Uncharacterized protein n=1 Tax=Ziziphus jujuba var. spinosa TaxID=714518 RepID=A0A978UMI7_ZIZJJ|nr:uncharacterized protein LOC107409270 [Ziziphus jujuba var. spinosa]KAH7516039.1 hypothetical protein FEM48_Zijuj10G0092200 [Ziziphus jujuba var. spinosa]